MGHFVGKDNIQVYVHDNGIVYTNDTMIHRLAGSEDEFLGKVSLIVPKLPDENGEIVYSDNKFKKGHGKNICPKCGFMAMTLSGYRSHVYKCKAGVING